MTSYKLKQFCSSLVQRRYRVAIAPCVQARHPHRELGDVPHLAMSSSQSPTVYPNITISFPRTTCAVAARSKHVAPPSERRLYRDSEPLTRPPYLSVNATLTAPATGHRQQSRPKSHPRGHAKHCPRRQDSHSIRSHDPRRPRPNSRLVLILRIVLRLLLAHRRRHRPILLPQPRGAAPSAGEDV